MVKAKPLVIQSTNPLNTINPANVTKKDGILIFRVKKPFNAPIPQAKSRQRNNAGIIPKVGTMEKNTTGVKPKTDPTDKSNSPEIIKNATPTAMIPNSPTEFKIAWIFPLLKKSGFVAKKIEYVINIMEIIPNSLILNIFFKKLSFPNKSRPQADVLHRTALIIFSLNSSTVIFSFS